MNNIQGICCAVVLPSDSNELCEQHAILSNLLRVVRVASLPVELVPVVDAGDIDLLIHKRHLQMAIVLAPEQSSPAVVPNMRRLMERFQDLSWIALLPTGALADSGLCGLVSDYCADFLCFPTTATALQSALQAAWDAAQSHAPTMHRRFQDRPLVGVSPPMQALARSFPKIAPVDAPVLITGESGTGKELAARAIHAYSARASKPFIPIDCGSMPDTLIQSKLFGHEKGAFTGAVERRQGLIEAAEGGTVFLDKIENLPLNQQVNLLRFLQESVIEPVGSTKPVQVDVRIVAAAHQDLKELVAQGRLREDLFYRLNVLHIQLAPLRARGKDIELLAYHSLHRACESNGHASKDFSVSALDVIRSYTWPGNVRELINRIRRAVVMSESDRIRVEDLGFSVNGSSLDRPLMTLTEARAKAEQEIVLQSLKATGYNISASARLLKISRLSLYRLIDKYCLLKDETSEANSHG